MGYRNSVVTIDSHLSELVFDALGHCTRRDILALLQGGPRAVGEIARELPVSRPAVSKHLRTLSEAGLVASSSSGNRNVFRLDDSGFEAARGYLDEFWTVALDNFQRLVAAKKTKRG